MNRFVIIFFICSFFCVPMSSAQAQVEQEVPASRILTSSNTSIGITIEDLAYRTTDQQLIISTNIVNKTNSYLDELQYVAEFYYGDNLRGSGDIFADLEYAYQVTGKVNLMAPKGERKKVLEMQIPETLSEGNYFIKIIVTNNQATDYGLTYTQTPVFLSGTNRLATFESVQFVDEAGTELLSSVVEMEDDVYVKALLPDSYSHLENNEITFSLYKNKFSLAPVDDEILLSFDDIESFDPTTGEILIRVEESQIPAPGLYVVELGIVTSEGTPLITKTREQFIVAGYFAYMRDITIPQKSFETGQPLDTVVSLVSNYQTPITLTAVIETTEGEIITFTKEVVNRDIAKVIDVFLTDFSFEDDVEFESIAISVYDTETDRLLDKHTFVFSLEGVLNDETVISDGQFKKYITLGIVVLLIILFAIAITYAIKRKKQSTAAYLIIIMTTLVSGIISWNSQTLNAFELVPSLTLGSVDQSQDAGLCPRTERIALVGSSVCPIDGTQVAGTISMQSRVGSLEEWSSGDEYAFVPATNYTKLFGPYIYDYSLSDTDQDISVRGQFTVDGEQESFCDQLVSVSTEPETLSCAVDICSNIDGAQTRLPAADEWFTSFGRRDRATELGMTRVGTQCFSVCSGDTRCPAGSECFADSVAGKNYCRPQLSNTCVVSNDIEFSSPGRVFKLGEQVFFKVNTGGGTQAYGYDWTGIDDTVESNIAVRTFDLVGDYTVSAEVTSGELSSQVSCPVSIRECVRNSDCSLGTQCSSNGSCVESPLVASCSAYANADRTNKIQRADIGQTVYWDVTTTGGNSPFSYVWEGDVSSSGKTPETSYSSAGIKRTIVTASDSASSPQEVTVQCDITVSECSLGDNSACAEGLVCRPDLLCGPPLPYINRFEIEGSSFASDGGTCAIGLTAGNVSKCSVINIGTNGSVSVTSNANDVVNETINVSLGSYMVECQNENGDTVTEEGLSCNGLPTTRAF